MHRLRKPSIAAAVLGSVIMFTPPDTQAGNVDADQAARLVLTTRCRMYPPRTGAQPLKIDDVMAPALGAGNKLLAAGKTVAAASLYDTALNLALTGACFLNANLATKERVSLMIDALKDLESADPIKGGLDAIKHNIFAYLNKSEGAQLSRDRIVVQLQKCFEFINLRNLNVSSEKHEQKESSAPQKDKLESFCDCILHRELGERQDDAQARNGGPICRFSLRSRCWLSPALWFNSPYVTEC